jgi:membrane protease YdiL (CAAX protease family)
MKSMQAIWRLMSRSWLVAAPLIIIFVLVAIPLLLSVVHDIIARVSGAEAADVFADNMFGAMMWGAELTFLLAPVALVLVARRWLRKKGP